MFESNTSTLELSSYPSLLTHHVMKGLADESVEAFRMRFFDGGIAIYHLRGREWELDDTVARNSERLHDAYEIARIFGWVDKHPKDTTWARVELRPSHIGLRVRMVPTEMGLPDIFFSFLDQPAPP